MARPPPFARRATRCLTSTPWPTPAAGTQNYLIGLASRFREANVSVSVDWVPFWSKHVVVNADWVRNYGFDRQEILARTQLPLSPDLRPRVIGMQERVAFGDVAYDKRNAWQVYLATVAWSATLSSMHLRIPTSGSVVPTLRVTTWAGRYAFVPNTTFGVRWYSASRLMGRRWQSMSCSWMLSPPSGSHMRKHSIKVLGLIVTLMMLSTASAADDSENSASVRCCAGPRKPCARAKPNPPR